MNMCEKKIEKDDSVSVIRCIAMSAVILCHTFQQIGYSYGYSAAMGRAGDFCADGVQVFLVLSGYLYGKKVKLCGAASRVEFVKRNIWKILLEYYVYCVFVIIPVYAVREPLSITFRSVFGLLTASVTIPGVHHLWFIPYILLCYLATPALYDIRQYFCHPAGGYKRRIAVTVVLAVMIDILSYAFHSYFISAWVNGYVIGFLLPDLLENKGGGRMYLHAVWYVLAAWLTVVRYHANYDMLPQLEYGSISYLVCSSYINWCKTLLGFTYILLVKDAAFFIRPSGTGRLRHILDVMDRYSYCIYITHMIFVKGCLGLLAVTESYAVNFIIMLAAAFSSAYILFHACSLIRGRAAGMKKWRKTDA